VNTAHNQFAQKASARAVDELELCQVKSGKWYAVRRHEQLADLLDPRFEPFPLKLD
jgi:hypothetical protein